MNAITALPVRHQDWPDSPAHFPVGQFPVQAIGKTGITAPAPRHKAIVRIQDGQPRILSIMGDDYKLLKHHHVHTAVQEAIEHAMPYERRASVRVTDRTSFDGAWTERQYVFPNFSVPVGRTTINYRIISRNSYDGSTSAYLMHGGFDVICTNGLYVGIASKYRRRHTSGADPAQLAAQIESGLEHWQEAARVWQRWANTEVSDAAVKTWLDQLDVSDKLRETLAVQIEHERQDRGSTVWAVYSALTFYASHTRHGFRVRNTGLDNLAATLAKREDTVAQWVAQPAWRALAA